MFVPVASVMIAVHRDRLVLASTAQWSEIQQLVSQGQIVSADPPLLTDRRMDKYNFNLMIHIMRNGIIHTHQWISSKKYAVLVKF